MRFLSMLTIAVSTLSLSAGKPVHPSITSDTVAIQQTLNIFPLSVDRKDYSRLAEVFSQDVTADFLVGPVCHGLTAVQQQLQAHLEGLGSHHSLTTQSIQFPDAGTATATSYLIATFFGQGQLVGQFLTDYGRYDDTLVRDDGWWKVNNRTLVIVVWTLPPRYLLVRSRKLGRLTFPQGASWEPRCCRAQLYLGTPIHLALPESLKYGRESIQALWNSP